MSSARPRRRSSAAERESGEGIAALYGDFADDYHWLHDAIQLRLGTTTPGVRAAFHGLAPEARILDAACGIGLDANALHRRGFRVTAVDVSPAMVDESRRRLASAGGGVEVHVCSWTELPGRFPADSFDAVLCTGNSIAHVRSAAEMVEVFRSFARVLAPGGLLILDTHHWDVLDRVGERTIVDPVVVERNGARCVRSYTWRRAGAGASSWNLELRLDIDEVTGPRTTALAVEMVPFSTGELRERLRTAGFTHISIDASDDEDRYTAIGRRGLTDPTG